MSDRRRQLGTLAVFALVLLRLAIGWHFYREGSAKLVYDKSTGRFDVTFSAESFLSQAKGPLAGWIHQMVPSGHGWSELLAVAPANASDDSGEAPGAPYDVWSQRILEDWAERLANVSKLPGITPEQKQAATSAYEARRKELLEYLAAEADAIAEYQHERQRIDQWRATPEAEGVPFVERRIAAHDAQSRNMPRVWVDQVAKLEQQLTNDLRNILVADQRADPATALAIDEALTSDVERRLRITNIAVTALIVAVGICLLIGFFTRLASLAGVLFLVAVIATQPPWVFDAAPTYYQMIELAGLIVLAATGAGRWAGLDYFSYAFCNRFCRSSNAEKV